MSKIALSGDASGTGTFTIASPNSNSNFTLTLPAESGTIVTGASGLNATNLTSGTIPKARMYAGAVLQVIQTTKTDAFSTSSTTFVDVTGMSASITPSSTSSKILIISMIGYGGPTTGTQQMKFLVGSTDLLVGDAAGSRTRANFGKNNFGTESDAPGSTFCFLHSPNSTSQQTYKLQIAGTTGNSAFINRTGFDGDNTSYGRYASTITLMEIAG